MSMSQEELEFQLREKEKQKEAEARAAEREAAIAAQAEVAQNNRGEAVRRLSRTEAPWYVPGGRVREALEGVEDPGLRSSIRRTAGEFSLLNYERTGRGLGASADAKVNVSPAVGNAAVNTLNTIGAKKPGDAGYINPPFTRDQIVGSRTETAPARTAERTRNEENISEVPLNLPPTRQANQVRDAFLTRNNVDEGVRNLSPLRGNTPEAQQAIQFGLSPKDFTELTRVEAPPSATGGPGAADVIRNQTTTRGAQLIGPGDTPRYQPIKYGNTTIYGKASQPGGRLDTFVGINSDPGRAYDPRTGRSAPTDTTVVNGTTPSLFGYRGQPAGVNRRGVSGQSNVDAMYQTPASSPYATEAQAIQDRWRQGIRADGSKIPGFTGAANYETPAQVQQRWNAGIRVDGKPYNSRLAAASEGGGVLRAAQAANRRARRAFNAAKERGVNAKNALRYAEAELMGLDAMVGADRNMVERRGDTLAAQSARERDATLRRGQDMDQAYRAASIQQGYDQIAANAYQSGMDRYEDYVDSSIEIASSAFMPRKLDSDEREAYEARNAGYIAQFGQPQPGMTRQQITRDARRSVATGVFLDALSREAGFQFSSLEDLLSGPSAALVQNPDGSGFRLGQDDYSFWAGIFRDGFFDALGYEVSGASEITIPGTDFQMTINELRKLMQKENARFDRDTLTDVFAPRNLDRNSPLRR